MSSLYKYPQELEGISLKVIRSALFCPFNFSRLSLKEYFEIEINQIHKIKSHRCCIINDSGVFQIRKRLPTTVGF